VRYIVFVLFVSILLQAKVKTPSDVYSQSMVLKEAIVLLRKQNDITTPLKKVQYQANKSPRHVIQKTLEILTKVNKYRELNGYGRITIPPVPARKITPQDVYYNVQRLREEVAYLIKGKHIFHKAKMYTNKTPSDVYTQLWTISLGFDALIGQGFTPTDVYAQTTQIIDTIMLLRDSQHSNNLVPMPKLKKNLHPNHALYKSIELLQKISNVEKLLWMTTTPVPKIEQKVISPTEVYDALQTVKAEINRIARRVGIEKSFVPQEIKERKTPSDVVQNLEYAIALMPSFSLETPLNQYPKQSLLKTPNDVFALSSYILDKITTIKAKKGIHLKAKETTYLYGLEPIHVYEKGIESLEKIAKLKMLEGFKPSQVPQSPSTKITPSEVYELILRLDDELNLIYKDSFKLSAYRALSNKKYFTDKTPSDAYNNLWKISYELDAILNQDYTPNETYILAKKIQNEIKLLEKFLIGKNIKVIPTHVKSKKPSDVFQKSIQLLELLQDVKERGNFKSVKIILPNEKIKTPTSVYNALRLVSATLSEIEVHYSIEPPYKDILNVKNKTPSDVYETVDDTIKIISNIFKDSNYED